MRGPTPRILGAPDADAGSFSIYTKHAVQKIVEGVGARFISMHIAMTRKNDDFEDGEDNIPRVASVFEFVAGSFSSEEMTSSSAVDLDCWPSLASLWDHISHFPMFLCISEHEWNATSSLFVCPRGQGFETAISIPPHAAATSEAFFDSLHDAKIRLSSENIPCCLDRT